MIFLPPRSKLMTDSLPPTLSGIERVNSLVCLGVKVNTNFSFNDYINDTINSCASNLYAIRYLKAKGLNDELVKSIFQATIISKLSYASQFWWGFLSSNDRERLEAFLRKASRCNFYSGSLSFKEIAQSADKNLFKSIISNPQHVLYQLLPPVKKSNSYELRPRAHNFTLPLKLNTLIAKNFLTRMLYSNCF